jgi:hypothetical protein
VCFVFLGWQQNVRRSLIERCFDFVAFQEVSFYSLGPIINAEIVVFIQNVPSSCLSGEYKTEVRQS